MVHISQRQLADYDFHAWGVAVMLFGSDGYDIAVIFEKGLIEAIHGDFDVIIRVRPRRRADVSQDSPVTFALRPAFRDTPVNHDRHMQWDTRRDLSDFPCSYLCPDFVENPLLVFSGLHRVIRGYIAGMAAEARSPPVPLVCPK